MSGFRVSGDRAAGEARREELDPFQPATKPTRRTSAWAISM